MTEKVVAALDSCRISYRKSVHIICAVAEALGCDTSVLILNKTSYNRSRKKIRAKCAGKIKILFKETDINAAVVHWDGKIITDSITCKRFDRLPIIVMVKLRKY